MCLWKNHKNNVISSSVGKLLTVLRTTDHAKGTRSVFINHTVSFICGLSFLRVPLIPNFIKICQVVLETKHSDEINNLQIVYLYSFCK